MNPKKISEAELEKHLVSETTKVTAFEHLKKNGVNPQMAYVRLGGPNIVHDSAKERFSMAYSKWWT